MMWWYGPGMNGWGYGLMTISVVLFWALIIFGIVALIRYIGRAGQVSTDRPTPRRLLDERFARGEIDEDLIHACLFHSLQRRIRKRVLDGRKDTTGLQSVWIKRDLVRRYVLECVIMVCPLAIAFSPRCDVLHDDFGTDLLRFHDRNVPVQAKFARWIIAARYLRSRAIAIGIQHNSGRILANGSWRRHVVHRYDIGACIHVAVHIHDC